MGKRKTHQEFSDQVKDRQFDVLERYTGATNKMRFRCKVDGHEWQATPDNILRGRGCPKCAGHCGNDILEKHNDWYLVDISTPVLKKASMAVDKNIWEAFEGGRVFATTLTKSKYIYALYNQGRGVSKRFHHLALPNRDGLEVDHIHHGSLGFIDNRLSNLRLVTRSQNNQNHNLREDNTSGIRGVSWTPAQRKWQAHISVNAKRLSLGAFATIASARGARERAEKEFFGKHNFAVNN